jgi:hypothetical protein
MQRWHVHSGLWRFRCRHQRSHLDDPAGLEATLADANCAKFLSGGVNPIASPNPGFTFDSVANDFMGWPNQGNSFLHHNPGSGEPALHMPEAVL